MSETAKEGSPDLRTLLAYEALREDAEAEQFDRPCVCGCGRLFHTFAPGGDSLCDVCGCEGYREAADETQGEEK